MAVRLWVVGNGEASLDRRGGHGVDMVRSRWTAEDSLIIMDEVYVVTIIILIGGINTDLRIPC